MKQMKKKSQKSTKQPIKVQLSKQDLMELLTVLKDFMSVELRGVIREGILAEFARQGKRLFLNSSENEKRITAIEAREEKNAITLTKKFRDLEWQSSCGVRTEHHFSVEYTNDCQTSFRCIKCELSYGKNNQDLNEKEKELLRVTLGRKNENSEISS
jgi:hypothetical protein